MRTNKKVLYAVTLASAIVASFVVMLMAPGCASTRITSREQFVTGKLPRPNQIWVYNFSATPADVPANSMLAGQIAEPATPQTEEEIAAGRELGAQIAAQLVEEIHAMGMPAMLASPETTPQINDIVLRGHLVSINEGDVAKRFIVGFGAGASRLSTAVEGFQMTPEGLRPLGMGEVAAGGNKGPGAALGAAALIATGNPAGLIISGAYHIYGQATGQSTVEGRARQTAREIGAVLRQRFLEQGWISQ